MRAAEDGFTLATAMLALLVVSLAMAATVTAVNGDVNLTNKDIDHKRAYEAAQAGLADYSFHLNADNGYWSKCTGVPTPNAVNNDGSTAKRRNVPGSTGASYAIELIPATGKSVCSTSDPVGSMIEQSGDSIGTFRVRSTGYAGDTEQRIVASFKRASFLDYVYFTQYETSDPVTYNSSADIATAYAQCETVLSRGPQHQHASVPGDRLHIQRVHQRPVAHQRRAQYLRDADLRARPIRPDRGQLAADGIPGVRKLHRQSGLRWHLPDQRAGSHPPEHQRQPA